ncbi:uncharacterized protein LOC129718215 isoform X10 [Wyeomyia smithii]|uniref:uncharacterized protein LOC129718215 isoform X10 n=1 Tax=Wyeomyia smithii TaxID=174621 RepID=UPI002467C186|nr:uncharacterized protein LOC129718215 isoform X10 [Wyeomyia smithii]
MTIIKRTFNPIPIRLDTPYKIVSVKSIFISSHLNQFDIFSVPHNRTSRALILISEQHKSAKKETFVSSNDCLNLVALGREKRGAVADGNHRRTSLFSPPDFIVELVNSGASVLREKQKLLCS